MDIYEALIPAAIADAAVLASFYDDRVIASWSTPNSAGPH